MNKSVAKKLNEAAHEAARCFSDPKRAKNTTAETFKVDEIKPLSETTAAVIYLKNTGKKALFFFYFVNTGSGGKWWYFVPTDSHLLGMEFVSRVKMTVEWFNFIKNFDEQKEG